MQKLNKKFNLKIVKLLVMILKSKLNGDNNDTE